MTKARKQTFWPRWLMAARRLGPEAEQSPGAVDRAKEDTPLGLSACKSVRLCLGRRGPMTAPKAASVPIFA